MSRGFKAALAFLFVIVLSLVLQDGPSGSALLRLLTGWTRHLSATLPQIQVDWSGVALLGVCFALAAVLGHRFCAWLWKGSGREDRWRPNWTAAGLCAVVLLFSAGMAFTGAVHQIGWLIRPKPDRGRLSLVYHELPAQMALLIAEAQLKFAENDHDRNGRRDYWRGELAELERQGLLNLNPGAEARARGTPPGSYHGHLIRALGFPNEGEMDRRRFAACVFPEPGSAKTWVYVISERLELWRKPFVQGKPPTSYPDDPRAQGWALMN